MNDSEERGELISDAAYKMRQLFEKWKNRLAFNNLRLIERYLACELEIFVHLRLVYSGCGDSPDLCAFLKYPYGVRGAGAAPPDRVLTELVEKGIDSRASWSGRVVTNTSSDNFVSNDKQNAVLVDVVQLANSPERVVPSVIRLSRLDEAYCSRAHSLYLSRERGYVSGGRFERRKGCVPAGRATVSLDQLPSQQVEGAAQVVNGVPDDKGENRVEIGLEPVNDLAGLRVLLTSNEIFVGFAKRHEPIFEITDVVFGPFDFRPDADEPV